jgi:hypothetical protein
LKLHIPKGFKSFVLKLRILWELEAGFCEMRILKGIARGEDKERELNAETVSARREERSGEGEDDRMECDESIGQGSMDCDYCQGLLLKEYQRGVGGIERVW